MVNDPTNRFYTYIWRRPDGTPFYVGKGHANRAHRTGSPRDRSLISIEFHETEELAFEREKELVIQLGRADKSLGILSNKKDGGCGGKGRIVSSAEIEKRAISIKRRAYKHPPHVRKLLGDLIRGKPSPMKGKKRSPEFCAKVRKAHERFKGVPLSEETKRKLSLALRGRKKSPEWIRKYSEAQRGKNRGRTGMKASKEARERLSIAITKWHRERKIKLINSEEGIETSDDGAA